MNLPVQDGRIVNGGQWCFDHRVLEACQIGDVVVVVFDWMDFPNYKQAQNLMGFDLDGRRLWVAQHPTNETVDCYTGFLSEEPLRVANFAGYACQIDVRTGKLLRSVFTK